MLRHIVLWKFKKEAEGKSRSDNLREARDRLLSLPPSIPAIRRIEVGIDIGRGQSSYDLALMVEVDDQRALDSYISHPAHQIVSEHITHLRESRVCVDMEF